MTTIGRRGLLKATGAGLASFALPRPFRGLDRILAGGDPPPTLVVIYLRGGVDALNVIVPYKDDRYYELRPTLAIAPEDSELGPGVVPLDGDFGLHPALAPLKPYWESKQFAALLNVGSPHPTRSHFDAQDFMEYAAPGLRTVRDGWLNRYLDGSHEPARRGEQEEQQGLRALAMQGLLPRSLRGRRAVLAVPEKNVLNDQKMLDLFGPLYGNGMDSMERGSEEEGSVYEAGRSTFETLKFYKRLVGGAGGASGVTYPKGAFPAKLRDLARVIRAGEGLEVAAIDVNGWDTHAGQGATEGTMANLLGALAGGLASFAQDLGPLMEQTLVVAMTEFGRTARENGNNGTDHGHGGMMLLLGGGVKGGRVHGKWTGLEENSLYQSRDLQVTTDFRDVFAELLRGHLDFDLPKDFFPGYRPGRVRGLLG
jgi:uncharacterized protein (DUF1501 family)